MRGVIETEGTHLVRADAPWRTPEEVDRGAVRIAVSASSALDLHLSRSLRDAQLVRIPGAVGAFDLFLAGKADVLAGVRQRLLAVAPQVPGSRILPGRFMVIENGAAVPRRRDAGARYLRAFIEEAKASGLVSQAIAANRIEGASVAPAAQLI